MPQPGQPLAYGYSRVSTGRQVDHGLSLQAQEAEVRKHFDYKLAPKGVLWGGMFCDKETRQGRRNGCSGKRAFRDRPAGGELDLRLREGDHLLVTALDRAFRSFKDAVAVSESWMERGVVLHLVRDGVSTESAMGKVWVRMLSMFAEFERSLISERTREALRMRKREGKAAGGQAPPGKMYAGNYGSRRLVEDAKESEVIDRIVALHKVQGYSFDEIWVILSQAKVRTRSNRAWSRARIYRAYRSRSQSDSSDLDTPRATSS